VEHHPILLRPSNTDSRNGITKCRKYENAKNGQRACWAGSADYELFRVFVLSSFRDPLSFMGVGLRRSPASLPHIPETKCETFSVEAEQQG
jgi:hypothetical protein